MADSSEQALNAGPPKEPFVIFNNGAFQYADPIIKRDLISPIHSKFGVVAEIYSPQIDPTTVWTIRPEHFGHFLTAIMVPVPSDAEWEAIIKQVNAVFGTELVDVDIMDMTKLRDILSMFDGYVWAPEEISKTGTPTHLAYLTLCYLYIRNFIANAETGLINPILAVAAAGFLDGHMMPYTAAVFMKPMFVVVENTFVLFKGYELSDRMQDFSSDDEMLKWSGDSLKRAMQSKVSLRERFPNLYMVAPTSLDRKNSAPVTNIMKQSDETFAAIDVHTANVLNSDVMFGMYQCTFMCVFKNMMSPSVSIFNNQAELDQVGFSAFLAGIAEETKVLASALLEKSANTILKVVGGHVTATKGEKPAYGDVSTKTTGDKTFTLLKLIGGNSLCATMLGCIISNSEADDAIASTDFTATYRMRGLAMFGAYSKFNSYGTFTEIANLTDGDDQNLIKDFSSPDLVKYALFISSDIQPFCYASLSAIIRQAVFGVMSSFILPVGLYIGENITNKVAVNILCANFSKISKLVIPFKFPKPSAEDIEAGNKTVIANLLDLHVGQNNIIVKNKMFTQMKKGKSLGDLNRVEWLTPTSTMRPEAVSLLKRNIPGMIRTVLSTNPNLRLIKPVFVDYNNTLLSTQRMMSTPAAVNYSPMLVDVYIQMYTDNSGKVAMCLKWNADMSSGVYYVKVFSNELITENHRKGVGSNAPVPKIIIEPQREVLDVAQAVLKLSTKAKGLVKAVAASVINTLYPNATEEEYTQIVAKLKDIKLSVRNDEEPMYKQKAAETEPMAAEEAGPSGGYAAAYNPAAGVGSKRKADTSIDSEAMAKKMKECAAGFDVDSDDE